ncbi:MAG: DUF1015 domain-containing protein [Acidimicrobiales bacterium]
MPQLLPFAGLRPGLAVVGSVDAVICPPYDIITEEQRVALMARSPYNVVRVELPNGQYGEAARLFQGWQMSRALVREENPALYGYRMSYVAPNGEPRHTLGVMGALVLEPPGRGILPHENTTPKAKSDRLELIRATHANTSPIWCLSCETGLADALGPVPAGEAEGGQRVTSARDDDGALHEIWALTDPATHHAVAKVVAASPLLVADGHHRYETALAYQAERRAKASGADAQGAALGDQGGERGEAGGERPGTVKAGYDAVLALVVELSEQQLQVQAIHRVVSALPAGFDIVGALGASFELEPTTAEGPKLLFEMDHVGALALITASGCWLATPRATGPAAGYELDSSRIDAALAALPPHNLAYEHDIAQALIAIRTGEANAAVFCRPATVSQIARTAHGGDRMPPKTTFFWPKPRTGMVMRDF